MAETATALVGQVEVHPSDPQGLEVVTASPSAYRAAMLRLGAQELADPNLSRNAFDGTVNLFAASAVLASAFDAVGELARGHAESIGARLPRAPLSFSPSPSPDVEAALSSVRLVKDGYQAAYALSLAA